MWYQRQRQAARRSLPVTARVSRRSLGVLGASREAPVGGAGGGVQQELRHRAEAREQARGHAAREAEVQQQRDAPESALPPDAGAARRGTAAGRPGHILELHDHLQGYTRF